MKSVFEFGDYKDYLKAVEQQSPRGARRRMAEAWDVSPLTPPRSSTPARI